MPRSDVSAVDGSIAHIIQNTRDVIGGEKTEIGTLLEPLGQFSHSALLLVPAMLVVTPISGIPGVSGSCGVIIALVSLQMLLGRRSLWLPEYILKIQIDSGKLGAALKMLHKPSLFIDRYTRRRFHLFVRSPGSIITKALCFACGAVMPLLEFIPFSSSVLGAAVSLFAVSLLTRDGALAAAGVMVIAALGFFLARLIL